MSTSRAGNGAASNVVALVGFAVFTVVAVVGFGAFGRHPDWIPDWAWARNFYRVSFQFFGQIHAGLAAAVLALALTRAAKWSWVMSAVGVYAIALAAEYLGTRTGLPFGPYRYSGLMGAKIGGHVPWLIPLSWFVMAVPCYRLALSAWGHSPRLIRLLGATALLVTWDLALDPAMSALTPYWIWEVEGVYYGMPLINLVGWAITGLVIMGFLEAVGAKTWSATLPVGWAAGFYAVMLALPLGMLIVSAAWTAVVCTVVTAGGLAAASRFRSHASGAAVT